MGFLKDLKTKTKPEPTKTKPKPKPTKPERAPIKAQDTPCPKCGKVHACGHRKGPKQTGRMLKAHCEPCGWIVRITRKCAAMGLPNCPMCGDRVKLEL